MTVLLDNTVLSYSSIVRQPELVHAAFVEQVGSTMQALQEMQTGVEIGKIPACDWNWLARVALTPLEYVRFEALHEYLGKGEASCLSVAQARGYRLATDDKDARRLARQLGISLTGSIGILTLLVKQSELPLAEGDHLLREMVAAGYRAPLMTLADILS
jgi:predicted nucleic acid-binding protein